MPSRAGRESFLEDGSVESELFFVPAKQENADGPERYTGKSEEVLRESKIFQRKRVQCFYE